MPKYVEKKFDLSEEEIQDLIQRSKNGDTVAQARMLEVFGNLLSKYVAFLMHGKWNIDEADMRYFVRMWVIDPNVGYHLKARKLNSAGYKHVNECIRGVTGMVNRYCDEEDVVQTVQMTFLHCVSKYERRMSKDGSGFVPFSGYLYWNLGYHIKKHTEMFLISQVGRRTYTLLEDSSTRYNDGDGGDIPDGYEAPPEPGVEEMLNTDTIDEFWVLGDTARWPFDQLSIKDRQLFKWRYVDGLHASDIAERLTEHANTVREHINKAKKNLITILEEEDL